MHRNESRIVDPRSSKAVAGRARRSDWDWSPRHGRWTPGHGYPANAAPVSMSTRDFADGNPYDAWRHHAYYTFDADPLPPGRARRFDAAVTGLVSTDGEFYSYRSHAMSGRSLPGMADRDAGDPLALGLVLHGERRSREGHDDTSVAGAGDFFLYDPRRAVEFVWTRHRAVHVMLRRPAVERALGRADPDTRSMLHALGTSPMAPVLRDQFASLARNLSQISPGERSFMLDQTVNLALFACSRTAVPESEGLFAAAMRLIERRLDDPALSADALAHTLNVSRATLYRAFAARDQAVAGTIRDARLDRALRLIARGARVGDAALACGWIDAANFARAFRARHGLRPSEVRETE